MMQWSCALQFAEHVPWLFGFLSDMVMSEDRHVRGLVRNILRRHVVAYLPGDKEEDEEEGGAK